MIAVATHRVGKARALALAVAFLGVAALAFAARAEALPARFWGVVPQSTLSTGQFQRLARGGVESVRIPLDWAWLQPQANGPIDWGGTDAMVEGAALAGLEVLPAIAGAPEWAVRAARVPGGHGSKAPAHLPVRGAAAGAWRSLLIQAVERYGPGGSFWAAHPGLAARPIRTWQVWNEPNFKYFDAHPNPAEYGKLVMLSSAALRAASSSAKVALSGLYVQPKGGRYLKVERHRKRVKRRGSPNFYASYFLERMYKSTPGIRSRFSAVALHPYTGKYTGLTPEIEEVRRVLAQNRDARKPLWITELSWSSERPNRADAFAKGPGGQARELRKAFALLRNRQARWRVKRVYWFSVDDQPGACNFCGGSGLFGAGFKPKRSWREYVRFAGGVP